MLKVEICVFCGISGIADCFQTNSFKADYVSELLDFEQIKFPEKAVLLETPLQISSWVELKSDSRLADRLAGRLAS